MLQAFLDWHRATLLYKCAGLTGVQLAERTVPPSGLSLLGLVRHMTEVERIWFRQRFAGEPVEHPFGGVKHSGLGVENGIWGLRSFTDMHLVVRLHS